MPQDAMPTPWCPNQATQRECPGMVFLAVSGESGIDGDVVECPPPDHHESATWIAGVAALNIWPQISSGQGRVGLPLVLNVETCGLLTESVHVTVWHSPEWGVSLGVEGGNGLMDLVADDVRVSDDDDLVVDDLATAPYRPALTPRSALHGIVAHPDVQHGVCRIPPVHDSAEGALPVLAASPPRDDHPCSTTHQGFHRRYGAGSRIMSDSHGAENQKCSRYTSISACSPIVRWMRA